PALRDVRKHERAEHAHVSKGRGARRSYAPMAWKPPSTWSISPVVAGNQSDIRATQAWATGSGLVTLQPSGARSAQTSSNVLKPSMLRAATVGRGPAHRRLT